MIPYLTLSLLCVGSKYASNWHLLDWTRHSKTQIHPYGIAENAPRCQMFLLNLLKFMIDQGI